MRFTGKLKSWNDDRGFGFIAPTEGGQDIFVHISECAGGRKPDLQQTLTFEVALNPQGKKKAVNVRGAEMADPIAAGRRGRVRERKTDEAAGGFMTGVIALAIVGAIGWWAFQHDGGRSIVPAFLVAPERVNPLQANPPAASGFACDGRIYCSQMTSCEEATFFLKNCPGTKMDGNHDGVPCEQQWCR